MVMESCTLHGGLYKDGLFLFAVPYSILPEPIRFVKIEEAEAYVEEKLSRPRKFKVISEVI